MSERSGGMMQPCRSCGRTIAGDATYCSSCGALQGSPSWPRGGASTMSSVLVALALVFFFPLGLVLMWTSSDWDDDVRWAITGLIFPPLWLRFLWKVPWLPYAIGAILAAVTVQALVFHGISAAAATAILTVIALVLLVAEAMRHGGTPRRRDRWTRLSGVVNRKLDACHDLIAAIEADLAIEFLPAGASLRRRYLHALELRSTAQELFQHASTERDLVEAGDRLSQSLLELRAVRDELSNHAPSPIDSSKLQ